MWNGCGRWAWRNGLSSSSIPNRLMISGVEARLNVYPTLTMKTSELLAEYPNPKQAAKQAERANNPRRNRCERRKARPTAPITAMAREMDAGGGSSNDAAENNGSVMAAAATPDSPSPMKLNPATRGAGGKKDVLGADPNAVPRAIADDSKRPQRVVEELAMAKMTRAIYSERQLQQVMDDFWLNHFNVFAGKGEVKWYLTSYERDVIQPNALGKFKDLLTATAKSPGDAVLSGQFSERGSESRTAPGDGACDAAADAARSVQLPAAAASTTGAEQETGSGAERELRARIDGIAHAGRGWRLYAKRCDGSGAVLHRVDD